VLGGVKTVMRILVFGLCMLFLLATSVAGEQVRIGNLIVYSGQDLEGFLSEHDGRAYISFPGAQPWALVDDEASYYPMPMDEVADAVRQTEFPVDSIYMHLLILPVPRQDLAKSSAEGRVVFLSPGALPYPREHVHYTVTHELGHVIHNTLMPDSRDDLWRKYTDLRGIGYSCPSSASNHAARLHEIFAEDFRALFGGELARFGGRVENHDLEPPDEVNGLREFFFWLVDQWRDRVQYSAYPNPFRDNVVFEAVGLDAGVYLIDVTVFDVHGRILQVLKTGSAAENRLVWDGRDANGKIARIGIYIIFVQAINDRNGVLHELKSTAVLARKL